MNGILDQDEVAAKGDPALSVQSDDCQGSEPICPGFPVSGDTSGLANDVFGFECDGAVGAFDAFYWYRPKWTGNAFLAINAPQINAVVSIHDECPATADNAIACNEGNPNGISFVAQKGQRYWIRVAGFAGAQGPYALEIIGPPCALAENDDNMTGFPDDCECDADVNGDCMVNKADYAQLLTMLGQSCVDCCEDIDGNGVVDVVDIKLLAANLGPCPRCECGCPDNGTTALQGTN